MGQAGSLGERGSYSSLKSAAAVRERGPNSVGVDTAKRAGPVLVPKSGKRVDNYVTSRVEAALDAGLRQRQHACVIPTSLTCAKLAWVISGGAVELPNSFCGRECEVAVQVSSVHFIGILFVLSMAPLSAQNTLPDPKDSSCWESLAARLLARAIPPRVELRVAVHVLSGIPVRARA